METGISRTCCGGVALALLLHWFQFAHAGKLFPIVFPEQCVIEIRDPQQLCKAIIPKLPPPLTVTDSDDQLSDFRLSLNEAIRIALDNMEVVRVLTGLSAASSGRTIYDAPIANTGIDDATARFNPEIQIRNSWNRFEPPSAIFDSTDPNRSVITSSRRDSYDLDFSLTKTIVTGAQIDFGVDVDQSRFQHSAFPLDPQADSRIDLGITQPLWQGGGIAVNMVPIVLARIDTERSFFQFKDSVQELVRGVIDAYWSVVAARIDVWAREQQIRQTKFAYDRSRDARAVGSGNDGEVAQSLVSLNNFRASLLSAKAILLQREAALRNVLGLPPMSAERIVPITPLSDQQQDLDWQQLIELAEVNRPDLIELKLVLEADQQLLLQAHNQAAPRTDAIAIYRWNGLEGEMPIGDRIASRPGQFNDWTLAVNFSVPLGLRRERAQLRRQELIISRDRANLQQGLHSAAHQIAIRYRNLRETFAQYELAQEIRDASGENLKQQSGRYSVGLTNFINYLLAITDWGNAVSSEGLQLTRYNTELANLERDTGTILESHGVRFLEEQYQSIGPLGKLGNCRCYPQRLRAGTNRERYPTTDAPSEKAFDLKSPGRDFSRPSAPLPSP